MRRLRDAKVLKMLLLNLRDCAWYLECFREVLMGGKARWKWVGEMNATRQLRIEDDLVRVCRKHKMEESRPMYAMEFLDAIV